MAIDIAKNNTHRISFPSKIASMMGQYAHVYNIELTDDTDNGALAGKGNYISFDNYEQAAPSTSFKGRINGQESGTGYWYVEVTALPANAEVLYIYNSPVSEYAERELQDEGLFYNAAGEVAQGAVLCLGDVFAVSANGFSGTPAAGKTVTFANDKFVVGA